jgi:hypothetical protein
LDQYNPIDVNAVLEPIEKMIRYERRKLSGETKVEIQRRKEEANNVLKTENLMHHSVKTQPGFSKRNWP